MLSFLHIRISYSMLINAFIVCYVIHAFPVTTSGEQENENFTEENLTISIPKIPKCCALDEAMLQPSEGCKPSTLDFVPPFSLEEPKVIDLIVGLKCDFGKYRLEPEATSEDEFHLLPDGTLSVPFQDQVKLSPAEYCFENTKVGDDIQVLPFLCFPPPSLKSENSWRRLSHIIYPIGSLTSVPFLIIVVWLYLGVTELRSTHGKVLACHSACLAFAYSSLSLVQLFGDQLPQILCVTMAFVIQFSFMACFFWLNLLCVHTWRQLNKGNPTRGRNTKCLFIAYSIYGWGVPILFIVGSIVMDLTPAIPSTYLKPNFGLDSCWFHSDTAALPYFYAPITILLIINLIFFGLTTRIVHKTGPSIVHRITTLEQAVASVIVQKRKQSFVQAVLLFLAMGINWILEVMSWAVGGPPQMWIIIDSINTLQGIVIFYIFVIRDPYVRRVFVKYFRGLCCCQEDPREPAEEERINGESYSQHRHKNGTSFKKFQSNIPLILLKNGKKIDDL